ncbi:hypothetical protein BD626DRAFT_506891 [Schizophyllum amplum]|uniref:Uncharacterized protein n=1 Tax=Schizophyllum amplum TaxID=97359 RepID=A0A550C578_9AGAR|nr:hypothetical protein BD626DRAFT_506891 [Auriculariopsis ampla]
MALHSWFSSANSTCRKSPMKSAGTIPKRQQCTSRLGSKPLFELSGPDSLRRCAYRWFLYVCSSPSELKLIVGRLTAGIRGKMEAPPAIRQEYVRLRRIMPLAEYGAPTLPARRPAVGDADASNVGDGSEPNRERVAHERREVKPVSRSMWMHNSGGPDFQARGGHAWKPGGGC